MFVLGQTYRRREIHETYGGQRQGGISTPAQHPFILLFTGDSGEQYGYHDGWQSNGLFYYTGEGQTGDMQMVRGNAAILQHVDNGDDPRTIPIVPGDMHDLLWAAYQEREANWPDCAWVFSRAGKQIKSFRKAWDDACAIARVPGLLFHDLRRTAVRNMRNAGVPQVILMKISGHKTDSMERRYNIVDLEDISHAREQMSCRMLQSKS